MKIIIDSRENTPFTFKGERYQDVEVITKKLDTGDYSLLGYEDKLAVERKSCDDLIQSISHERERFIRELKRGMELESFMVIVECPLIIIANGQYRSLMKAHSAVQSIISMQIKYKVPFVFADTVKLAEYYTFSFLHQYKRIKEENNN